MTKYPDGLLDWSGNRAGGVKKLFYGGSGRPVGKVIETPLLTRLWEWSDSVVQFEPGIPRAVLLLGGPGNGKTEAIEQTLRRIDSRLALSGALIDKLAAVFESKDGVPPGRLVEVDLGALSGGRSSGTISIVQDASEGNPGSPDLPAQLLCNDLAGLVEDNVSKRIYLACINRGVLDDALILATERGDTEIGALLKQIIRSVSMAAHGVSCWPLQGYPGIAVWPMDVETLVAGVQGQPSPAEQVLHIAANADHWPDFGACEAGQYCPFCTSRRLLSGEPHAGSLAKLLRWYELASGKRWNFRDLFSLVAHLLAGTPSNADASGYSPCKWAAKQLNPPGGDPRKADVLRKRGVFRLLASQYQHALFGDWPIEHASGLRRDIADLGLGDFPALVAIQQFLALDKRRESTATLRAQLSGMSSVLDPAKASPTFEVRVSANTVIRYEDLDRRFSLSIQGGREYLQEYQCLSEIEISALKVLEEADNKLSDHLVRRSRPATAIRVQALLRAIACRLARRSIGVRCCVTKDADVLEEFHRVTNGDSSALQQAIRQVEALLNVNRRFVVCLNNTFGEPLPPPERRAMLTTDIQRVKPVPALEGVERPRSPMPFLRVGAQGNARPIALTFDLFKATKSLRRGMVASSLPRSVVALLDTTRAGLAGAIVRDEDALEGAEIRIGIRDEVIVRTFGSFVIRQEGA
ncbi:hypothetical protein [Aquimonas voraii]|uniref:Uncharacterized protein n=1 Tax=Aquimonas voraii TaxID=265719 RepID=A0A1G6Z3G4_9GAMM|nr:hypothetical protein [Aquimonas voraii]SDD97170.1 hypothetical protein SAMN04488509_11228 [Aquimonas voraii]